MRLATRAAMRLHLDDVGYPGVWFDVRAGLTNAEQVRTTELTADLVALQRAQEAGEITAPEAARHATALQDELMVLLAVGTNVTEGADGSPLPPPTEAAFWTNMPDDIKAYLANWYRAERERRVARVRDFTERSSSPS